jgi:hypothetical protein
MWRDALRHVNHVCVDSFSVLHATAEQRISEHDPCTPRSPIATTMKFTTSTKINCDETASAGTRH